MVHEEYTETTQLPDTWNLLHGAHQGQPMLVRLNTGAERLASSGSHGIRIGVAVPFNAPRPDGLPEVVEGDVLAEFEDELVDLAGARGTLVAVITTGGVREFVLYTSDGWWVQQFHRDLESAMPTHHVQVEAKPDPEWDVYRSFRPWPSQR